jgi:hypothetical protein
MAMIYFFGGVFSTVASAVFLAGSVTVGASGAIFAGFGAFWAEFIQNWHLMGPVRVSYLQRHDHRSLPHKRTRCCGHHVHHSDTHSHTLAISPHVWIRPSP